MARGRTTAKLVAVLCVGGAVAAGLPGRGLTAAAADAGAGGVEPGGAVCRVARPGRPVGEEGSGMQQAAATRAGAAIPPIDEAAPARTRRATFALG